jgi:hypothetical protein
MIDALIGGKLHGKPIERTGPSTKFVVCKVRTPLQDGETVFVNVIAFEPEVCSALLALDDKDSVALSGAITPKVYTPKGGDPRPALDMVAHAITTTYHVTRKRKAMEADKYAQIREGA